MGIETTINIDDTEADQVLDAILATVKDLSPAYKRIGEHMLGSIEETFQAGGRPGKWPELSQATIISRMGGSGRKIFTKRGTFKASSAKKFGAIKPLIKTGRMLRSVSYKAGRENVRVGTNVVHAAIQHFGGKAGRGGAVKIPARPFIVIQDADMEKAGSFIVDYILSKVKDKG